MLYTGLLISSLIIWGDEQKNETQIFSSYYGVPTEDILHFCFSVLICEKRIKNLFALNRYYMGVN